MTDFQPSWRIIFADVALFGVAFGLTNVISYLYIVIAGRTLAAPEFGVFNALLGLMTLSGILATSVQLAVTQTAATSRSRPAFMALMRTTLRFALPGIALLTLAALPFASIIGANASQVVVCGLVLFSMFPGCAALGFLAGIGRIRSQAGINLLGAVARLAAGWPLMLAGVGVTGAVLGYLFNYVAVLLLGWWMVWLLASVRASDDTSGVPKLQLEVSAIATFVLAFAPFSVDQLLVQAVAPPLGGDYAALATISKLVFFATYPVIAVAYPYLLRRKDASSRARLLAAAALGVICIALSFAWALAAFPEQLTDSFFGNRFPEATPHVGLQAFGVACFTTSALSAHALIAWGNRMGFLPSMVALVVGVVLYAVRHDTLAAVVENQVWVYGSQLMLMSVLLGMTIRRSLIAGRLASLSRAIP
jgi:O-antigen/teichoic acid export membrane protein